MVFFMAFPLFKVRDPSRNVHDEAARLIGTYAHVMRSAPRPLGTERRKTGQACLMQVNGINQV
jgi:hypothetical protein